MMIVESQMEKNMGNAPNPQTQTPNPKNTKPQATKSSQILSWTLLEPGALERPLAEFARFWFRVGLGFWV